MLGFTTAAEDVTEAEGDGDGVGVAGVTIAGCAAAAEGDGKLEFDQEVGGGKLLIRPRIGLITGAADNEVGEGPMKDCTTAFDG